MSIAICAVAVLVPWAKAATRFLMDDTWRFHLGENTPTVNCSASEFPINLTGKQCLNLHPAAQYADVEGCRDGCCSDPTCEVFQFCAGKGCAEPRCWLGPMTDCNHVSKNMISFGRHVAPPPAPSPGRNCSTPFCQPSYDDKTWRLLKIPHDFVVEGNFSISNSDKSHGFKPYGVGWYRRHFDAPKGTNANPTIYLEFDGVQRNSDVYLNGQLLGHHDSGYTNFRFDISGKLLPKNNVLAVRADATQPDGWWYDGGGIYRHVWLTVAPEVHLAPDGLFANVTIPKVNEGAVTGSAIIDAQADVINAASEVVKVYVDFQVVDTAGTVIGTKQQSTVATLQPGTNTTVHAELTFTNIKLWSDKHPNLYTLKATINAGGKKGDNGDVIFGFRKIRFDLNKGFLLNDQPVKIRGLANHQDFAGVGVAVPDSLQRFRVSLLKKMGANGWRTAHNPPNPALLDETDRQGFLVWDENHRNNIGGQWDEDLVTMLRRDRNHPSIILWSLCNEILCGSFNAANAEYLKPIVKEFDNGKNARPVTAAMNGGQGDPFSHVLDVVGVNYHQNGYPAIHTNSNPSQPLIGSETSSALSDRGIYFTNATAAYMSAYDTNKPGWGATAEVAWNAINQHDFMAGCYIWTGYDYKGEPTPYSWPNINSHFGIIDIAGFPKDSFYYYQGQWRDDLRGKKSVVHMLPHWNWEPESCQGLCTRHENGSTTVNVWAYGGPDIASMELAVNGKIVGARTSLPNSTHVQWPAVPYTPGTIQCNGYDKLGQLLNSHIITTAGKMHSLSITVEQGMDGLKADNDDVALIRIAVHDSRGVFCPTASPFLSFSVQGPGKIIGVGNGDPSSHEPDQIQPWTRSAWNGLARAIVQTSDKEGDIIFTATSPGLKSASVTIKVTHPAENVATL